MSQSSLSSFWGHVVTPGGVDVLPAQASAQASAQVPKAHATAAVHDDDDDDEEHEALVNSYRKKWSCTLIRRKIQEFLATREMSQTKFLEAIGGVNSNSFGRFMKLSGAYSGVDNGTYRGAVRFFMTRELAAKSAKKGESSVEKKRKRDEDAPAKACKKGALDALLALADAVKLPPLPPCHPQDESAPAYLRIHDQLNKYEEHAVLDSCDDVRRGALAFIAEHGLSTAHFLRLIGNVNQKSWSNFLECRGVGAGVYRQPGAGNGAYHKAFFFLERVRIAANLPKSAKRVAFEAQYPRGYSLKHDNGMRWVLGPK